MKKIIQITAGRGPIECSWVVAQVLKYFLAAIKNKGFQYLILQRVPGLENGTIQSVTLQLEGEDLGAFLKNWIGTIQWIGTSTFRKYNKRKNWFIGVFELEQKQVSEINEKDISFQTMRSKGPGGQHVNKVNSAVRALHMKTGVFVVAMDSRSQHQNKKIAIERLKQKVVEANLELMKKQIESQWENHLQLQRGNPIQVFKGSDFKKKKEQSSYKTKRGKLKDDLRKRLNE
ncbi:MAG: peptide chain release factor H [Flavobacteriaceae bacterium]|nr:peptide chain release factor H [Flavobacteriaceae bacterium]